MDFRKGTDSEWIKNVQKGAKMEQYYDIEST